MKHNRTHFSFIFLTFCCAPEKLTTATRYCTFLHIVSKVDYRTKVTDQSPLAFSTSSAPWYAAPFLLEILKNRKWRFWFASQRKFKQTNIWIPVFYEHSNIKERDEWIRLLYKFHWLMMQVMLTFFAIMIWNIHL